MTDTKQIDPETYHVEDDLGPGWLEHQDLAHISTKIRLLAYPIAELIEDPSNVRKHDDANLEGIRGAYAKYQQRVLLVVNVRTMVVEKGNGSLRTLRANGFKFAAVLFVDDDPATATGFAIADNRTAETATWDLPALLGQLKSLKEVDHEVPAIDQSFFDELVAIVGDADFTPGADEPGEDPGAEDPPVNPVSKAGEIYRLGPHRLLCGDSNKGVTELLAGDVPSMAFADPPYNVNYNKQSKPDSDGQQESLITNDSMSTEEWLTFTRQVAEGLAKITGGCVYVCHSPGPEGRIMAGALDAVMHWSASIVWAKNQLVFGRASYQRKHEVIWFGWPRSAKRTFTDDRTITDVWEFNKPSKSELHPTMKPVALVQQAIEHASTPGQIVYDPFLGSGTTLIAAAMLGRRCYGVEIEPRYVDVCRRRWGEYARSVGVDPGPDAL